MLQKRILCLALCLVCGLGLVGGALALELDCDEQYCFQSADFSDDESLTGICITGLPDPSAGTVMLGTRVLRPGDILTVDQIRQMTFVPLRTEEDQDACVTYLPIYPNRVEADTTMSISIRGKEDKAPVAEDDAIETYKNLPNTGKLKAYDPEEQPLTYSVIRQPKRGTVTVAEDGSFTYTPKKNKVGTDSFTYTATDPAGKVSREATVTIQIMKPSNSQQYTDTIGTDCRFAAEWMKNTGLFVGEQVGGTTCFQPQKAVSRGEFLTMLVKTLDMTVDENADFTGFTDETPNWLKPYLAAALRSGMTENWPDRQCFGGSQNITGAEAALLVQNALDLPSSVTTGKENDGELPVWAEAAVAAMSDQGIDLEPTAELTRQQVALMLYDISKLATSLPNSEVY